jgi:hypothetical protein
VTCFAPSAVPEALVHCDQHTSLSTFDSPPDTDELLLDVRQQAPDTQNDHSQETILRTTQQTRVTT